LSDIVPALTAGSGVPGGPVDGAVLLGEVLGVADAAAGVGHQPVGGGIGEGQPAEDVVVGGGALLLDRALGARPVVREGDHQLPALQVAAQHEGHLLHPRRQRPRLHGNLHAQRKRERELAEVH